MNTMKTVLVAFTTLSLSVGVAFAQEGGDAYPVQAPKAAEPASAKAQVQSGTSDVPQSDWLAVPNYADRS